MYQKVFFNAWDRTNLSFNESANNDSALFTFRQVGYIEPKPTYLNIKEGYPELFVLFLVEGNMSLKYENQKYSLRSNDFFFLDSRKRFELKATEEHSFLYFMYIKGCYIDNIYSRFRQMHNSPIIQNAFCLKEPFAEMVARLHKCQDLNAPSTKLFINNEIYSFLSSILVNVENEANDSDLKQTLDYIYENYKNEIRIDDLARVSGYNKHYFIKLFKHKYNETPARFLNLYRAKQALNVVMTEKKTIEQAAYESGFKDKRSFIRICKTSFGTTPGKLIKNKRLALGYDKNGE